MLKSINTLVFDLDGTISNPSLGIYRCVNHALKAHHLSELTLEQVSAEIGPPLDETFRKFFPALDQAIISSLIAKYRERYAEVGYSENKIYPGIAESLYAFSARGVRMGVCTSKRKDFAEKILELFGIASYFNFVDGGDIGITKRDQLSGLLRSNTINQEAIMIGDREVDISSAKANGLRSIGVLWGFGNWAELNGAGADVILGNTNDLPQLDTHCFN